MHLRKGMWHFELTQSVFPQVFAAQNLPRLLRVLWVMGWWSGVLFFCDAVVIVFAF